MFSSFFAPSTFWFLLGFGFLLFELISFSVFTLFFGFGAWIVCFVLLFIPLSTNVSLLIFALASFTSLIFFRKKALRFLRGKRASDLNYPDSLAQDFIHQEVSVIEEIDTHKPGRVLLHGVSWQAKAHEKLPVGSRVRVIEQDNLMLTVVKLTETRST